jgi:hypothetical protein
MGQAAISDLIVTHRKSHNRRQHPAVYPVWGCWLNCLVRSLGTIVKDALKCRRRETSSDN